MCFVLFVDTCLFPVFFFPQLHAKWIPFTYAFLGSVGALAYPCISSLKANNVAVDEQGAIQGALNSARCAAGAMGQVMYGQIYAISISAGARAGGYYMPNAMFYVATLLGAVSVVLCGYIPRGLNETWLWYEKARRARWLEKQSRPGLLEGLLDDADSVGSIGSGKMNSSLSNFAAFEPGEDTVLSSLESEAHDGTANRQRSKSEMGYGTDPGAKFNHKAYASEGVTLNQPTLKRMDSYTESTDFWHSPRRMIPRNKQQEQIVGGTVSSRFGGSL